MERLTHKRCNGIKIGYWSPSKKQDLVDRLAAYEDTELTVEQVKELNERDIAKIPNLEGDGYDDAGKMIFDTWICPNCEEKYELDYREHKFCPECGQRINWEVIKWFV